MPRPAIRKQDLLYPELSYQIVGILFSAGIEIGFDHKEKFYQKVIANKLKESGLKFAEQLPAKVYYKKEFIGIYYFDFFIEGKIVLEIKAKSFFSQKDIQQLYSYLKAKGLKLGILAYFTKSGVRFKRIVNL